MFNHLFGIAKGILDYQFFYELWQFLVGGKRFRRKIMSSHFNSSKGMLDLGCGTADSALWLNVESWYVGIDISCKYVEKASKRIARRANSRVFLGDITKFHYQDLELQGDFSILGFGILHHLNSDQVNQLIVSLSENFKGARALFVDPTILESSNKIERWFAENDRGEYVRTPFEMKNLLAKIQVTNFRLEILDHPYRTPTNVLVTQVIL